MKILFLSPYFYPHIGGVEKHILEVGKELTNGGHKITVIAQKLKGERLVDKAAGITIYRIQTGADDWFKKFRIWREIWKRRKLIESSDIVHCHDVFFWYIPFRFIYPRKKVYTTFHGYEGEYPISKKAFFVRRLSEELSFGNIAVGRFIKKWYGTNSKHIVYGGVGKTKVVLPKTGDKNKLKILLIGRLEKDIGVEIYLRALRILKEEGVSFSLSVLGDGSFKRKFLGLGKVYGFVKNIESFISKADIVFASSYLSILEALAYKKLIFAVYDNPIKKDYLEMTPFGKWLFIKDSPQTLALEIKKQSKSPVKDKKEAYEWVKGQTWQKIAKLYLNLYK